MRHPLAEDIRTAGLMITGITLGAILLIIALFYHGLRSLMDVILHRPLP